MTFNFQQSASSGTSSGSLFGTSGGSGGGLFGSGSTGFSFGSGQNTTSSNAGESRPTFGTAGSDPKPPANLFGPPSSQPSTGSTPSFNFMSSSKPAEGSSSLFGTPKAPTPSFGSTTPAAAGSWSFGNPSTTPAGPPPAATQLGASTGGGASLFGGTKPTPDSASKPATFSFGKDTTAAASSNSAAAPTPPNVFGAPSSKQQEGPSQTPAAPQPQKAGFFGQTASAPTTNSPSAPLFGATAPKSTPTPPLFGGGPTTSQAPSSQPSGPSLFSQPAAPPSSQASPKTAFTFPAPGQPQPSANPTPSSGTEKPPFGGLGATTTTAPQGKSFFSATPATTAPVTATSTTKPLFGAAPTTSAAPTAAPTATTATTSATSAFSFAPTTAPTTQAAPSVSAFAASTSGPLPQPQSRLKNKTMDEILTRWATDLTKYTKDFKSHADTVAKWDQIIVDNSSKIDKLYVKTRTCEKQTMSVELQLSAVENQQSELESWLTKYENDVEAMLSKEAATPSEVGGPDQERERTYKLAEKLSEKLDGMEKDLSGMVDEINAANASLSKNGKADEPITQIVRILNSHLSQLQAIDQGTAALQAKVVEAQKAANGLGYLNGGSGRDGRVAVEDFYRSYTGRR